MRVAIYGKYISYETLPAISSLMEHLKACEAEVICEANFAAFLYQSYQCSPPFDGFSEEDFCVRKRFQFY